MVIWFGVTNGNDMQLLDCIHVLVKKTCPAKSIANGIEVQYLLQYFCNTEILTALTALVDDWTSEVYD